MNLYDTTVSYPPCIVLDLTLALCILSDILRMDSTNGDALYVRGLCLYYEDCIDKAVQFFIQALRMAPDHEKARLACRVRLYNVYKNIDYIDFIALFLVHHTDFIFVTDCCFYRMLKP